MNSTLVIRVHGPVYSDVNCAATQMRNKEDKKQQVYNLSQLKTERVTMSSPYGSDRSISFRLLLNIYTQLFASFGTGTFEHFLSR